MTQRATVSFTLAWVALALTSVSSLVFGPIATARGDASDPPALRALGVASMGMGLFGVMITVRAYRRRQRWAWCTLWYSPVFWTVHLLGGLPPGHDHVHQIVLVILSLGGLLLPVRACFPRGAKRRDH